MKNQYFGDINDYRKYGLIRALTGFGEIRCMICWMLTVDDDRSDGGKLDYLLKPDTFGGFDKELFDTLRESVVLEGKRSVHVAEKMDIVPGAEYYSAILTDDPQERSCYFDEFIWKAQGKGLLFFDPDNGMEIQSVSRGNKNSSKYLYWVELQRVHALDASILIYQHFPRENRDSFIERMLAAFKSRTDYDQVLSFRTSHVVFFLLAVDKQMEIIDRGTAKLLTQWEGQFTASNS